MTAQFDLFANPLARARRSYPFVVNLQSDLATIERTKVVAFLVPHAAGVSPRSRLFPVVHHDGRALIVLVSRMLTVDASDLGPVVGSLAADRDPLLGALDLLFLGI